MFLILKKKIYFLYFTIFFLCSIGISLSAHSKHPIYTEIDRLRAAEDLASAAGVNAELDIYDQEAMAKHFNAFLAKHPYDFAALKKQKKDYITPAYYAWLQRMPRVMAALIAAGDKIPSYKVRFAEARKRCLVNYGDTYSHSRAEFYEDFPSGHEEFSHFIDQKGNIVDMKKFYVGGFFSKIARAVQVHISHTTKGPIDRLDYHFSKDWTMTPYGLALDRLIRDMGAFSAKKQLDDVQQAAMLKCVVPKLFTYDLEQGAMGRLRNIVIPGGIAIKRGHGQCLDFTKVTVFLAERLGIPVEARFAAQHAYVAYKFSKGGWYSTEPQRSSMVFFKTPKDKKKK